MSNRQMKFVDGTSALAPSALLEAEFIKDRWDVQNIPGLRYSAHTNDHYLVFTKIPTTFRQAVKDFIKFQIAADWTAKTLANCMTCLTRFFTFFVQRYPEEETLERLTEQDVDAFILSLKTIASTDGWKNSNAWIWYHVHYLEAILSYLERTQSLMQPKEPTIRIIWPHHYPPKGRSGPETVKYIPQTVLKQLEQHIHHLPPACIPVVILLRASGWRISDVLYLKIDTCLEQHGDKYSLVGDIQKTQVLEHKIPITKEVAAVILAQREWVRQHYPAEENPQLWLFPAANHARYRNSRRFLKRLSLGAKQVSDALNQLALTYQIRDEQGNVFHFKLHAFRHTKAVELINNGMSLVMVQQWMAHASPEMTLIYAKILDETMRKQWEKTVELGIVQFNDGKPEYVPGKKLLPMTGTNTFDPERVREHRQNVKMALGSCLKTAKIMCKFVELPCFHCPAYVLTPEDLPALEAYEQQILERIEIGKQATNLHWIEVNQKNLDERVRPTIALLKQGHIVAKTDKQEREYTDEEWERHQHHGKTENA